jgi:hypothetical protein
MFDELLRRAECLFASFGGHGSEQGELVGDTREPNIQILLFNRHEGHRIASTRASKLGRPDAYAGVGSAEKRTSTQWIPADNRRVLKDV